MEITHSNFHGHRISSLARAGGGKPEYAVAASPSLADGDYEGKNGTITLTGIDGTITTFRISPVVLPTAFSTETKIFSRIESVTSPGGYKLNYDVGYDVLSGNQLRPVINAITDSFDRRMEFSYNVTTWFNEDNTPQQYFETDGTPKRPVRYTISKVVLPDGSEMS